MPEPTTGVVPTCPTEIAVALQGEPKTPEELVKVAMMRYDFERGGGSNWFSTFWMYVGRKLGMSEAGLLMDREWSEIQELTGLGLKATDDEIAAAVGRLGAADAATVAKLGGRIASDAERYREAARRARAVSVESTRS